MVHPAVKPGPARAGSGARMFTIVAFVFAVVALVLYPVVFGLTGAVLGAIGATRGDKPLGWYATAAGVGCAIVGMVLGAIVYSAAG